MLNFRNFSSKDLRKYAPYLVVLLLLAAVIIPVWADAPTQVSTFAELKAALAKGGNIKVMADIVDEEAGSLEITKDVTLDLNGHKLSKTNITGSDAGDQTRYFFNVYDGTFTINNSANKVGEINAAGATKAANPRAVAANAREENKHPKVIVNKGVKLSATNPTIIGWFSETTYKNAKGHALGVYTPNGYASDARKEPSSRTSSAEAIINEGATLNGIRQGIYVEGYGAKVTVNGGYVNGTRQAIYNGGGAEVVVNGGVLSAAFRNAISNCKATATINGGTWLGVNNAAISNFDNDSYIDPQTGETKHDYPESSAKSVLTVNGGTFSGNVYNDDGNTLKIYNGKFTDGYRAEMFLAEGATGAWEDNWYVVRSYEQIDTAQEFLNAVAKGGSYKLGSDIVLTNYVEISKDLTLDMNGHKLSRTNITCGEVGDNDRYFIIVRNGTFTINNNSGTQGQIYAATPVATAAPRAVSAFPNADGSDAKIIVNGNVLIKGYNSNGYGSAKSGINGIGVFTGYESDEYASSSARKKSAEAIINAGNINGTKHGISIEGYGAKVTINGGDVSGGRRGIVVCAGAEAVVNAGNVSGNQDSIMSEKATAIINGGTVTGGTRSAIYLYPDTDNAEYPKIARVTEARVNNGTISGELYPDTGTILANGGKFTADPSAYKAKGATVTQEGNYYVVKLGDGCIGNLDQLFAAADTGGEYTLGADIEIPLNYNKVLLSKDFTLHMNGYTIHKTINIATGSKRSVLIVCDGTTTINGPGEIVSEAVENPQAKPRPVQVSAEDSGAAAKLILNGTKGELKITDKGGTAYNINDQTYGGPSAIYVYTNNTEGSILRTAKCEINGNVTATSERHAFVVEGPGCYLTINDGTFSGARCAISNNFGGVITVNGGTFTGQTNALYNCKATATINNGTFTGVKRVIYNNDESEEPTPEYPSSVTVPTINIADGTFNGDIVNLTGALPSKLTISGGKYTADPTDYLDTGCKAEKQGEYYVVSQTESSSTYKVTSDKEGAIPGDTFTAKIKVLFKDLQDRMIINIDAVVNYVTELFELISAEKGDIPDSTEPKTGTLGEVGFGLTSMEGVALEEGQYYDFGTMTFKIKKNAAVGAKGSLNISDAVYVLDNYNENTPTIINTEIEVYQPVTAINISPSTGSTTMLVQSTLQLNAEVLPVTAQTKDILWTSNDESIATVDANGLVTSQMINGKTANVTITAKALDGSNVTGNITLTVKRPKVTGMNFAQAAYELESDSATKNLYSELSVTPETALKPATNEITWQSSNANFAVDANGVVSIVTPTEEKQTTTITAKYINEDSETITATCTVNSKPKKIKLNLTTKLEGRQSGGGTGTNVENIELYIYDSANKPLWNGSGTTDANGNVSFEIDSSILEAGQTVKLWIKGERYLAKLFTQTVTLSGNDWNVTMPEALKAADTNADNRVASADFLALRKSYMSREGSPDFNRLADFDANGRIASADFLLLRRNYMARGDNKPQAAVTMLMTAAARKGSTDTAMEVLNTETAQIAEEALANSTATDEETQEEEILYAVQKATNAPLKAENPATSSANSSSDSNSGSSSSSGGCNAGYGAFALLFAIPLIFKKRK